MIIMSFGKIINQLTVNSNITHLSFKNREEYVDFYNALLNKDSDNIFITINDKKIDLVKESFFLESMFSFNVNEKGNLKILYKNAELSLTDKESEEFSRINEQISNFLNGLYPENKLETIFSESIELADLLNTFKYRYSDECYGLVDRFCCILKMISMVGKVEIVFSNDLLKIFNDDELAIITEELNHLHLFIIDITFIKSDDLTFNKMDTFVIDESFFCY